MILIIEIRKTVQLVHTFTAAVAHTHEYIGISVHYVQLAEWAQFTENCVFTVCLDVF